MAMVGDSRGVRGRRQSARHAESTVEHSPLNERPIEEVWVEYQETRSAELRNFLTEKYLYLVRHGAMRVHARLPDEVDVEDLMSAGLFGLMGAINSFDLDRNVKFETYCAPRIRGAILDELRSMDWVPRLVRVRVHKYDSARRRIEAQTGFTPTDDEIARELAVDEEEFAKIKRDSSAVTTTSITRRETSRGDETREIEVARDDDDALPLRHVQERDLRDLITKGLSRAERLIVILYYYEGMTMKEIGATLDLSESRVSQMHSSILARLKAHMRERDQELVGTTA